MHNGYVTVNHPIKKRKKMGYITIAVIGALIIVGVIIFIYLVVGPLLIGSDEVATVEKRFGRQLKSGELIAMNREAGFQADTLRAGLHFKSRIIYKIHRNKMITIGGDEIGYVFARSGKPLDSDQALGRAVECSKFQDARAFIMNGGQQGMQREILREGTYAFNLSQFVIITEKATYEIPIGKNNDMEIKEITLKIAQCDGFHPVVITGENDSMGTVVTNEGRPLIQSEELTGKEVIAPIVGNDSEDPEHYHNCFQKIDAFLKAGGYKGRQLQILTQGKYYINRLFATVYLEPNVVIGPSEVGVVTSYFGNTGEDLTGAAYTHGDLVGDGCKGVLAKPLKTGKYPLNPYAYQVTLVPTENFVLSWEKQQTNDYNYDADLRELSVITKDGLRPEVPISVIVHIDYQNAPRVIQRFGNIKKLVTQTIDPMISAYFKKVAENYTLIEFIQNKSSISDEAKATMQKEFLNFNLDVEGVLIDTPRSDGDGRIENMLAQLSDRQLAVEQQKTYAQQMETAKSKKDMNEQQARAEMQPELTKSATQIDIDSNKAEAQRKMAEKEKETTILRAQAQAESTKAIADADAYKTKNMGAAEAEKVRAIGLANAEAASKSVEAYGGADLLVKKDALIAFADAIREGKIAVVPQNYIINGKDGSESGNALTQLLELMSLKKMGADISVKTRDTETKEEAVTEKQA